MPVHVALVVVLLLIAVPAGAYEARLIRNLHEGSGGVEARALLEVDGRLFLALNDGVHGEELWATDGTDLGTVLVRDIHVGSPGAGIADVAAAGGLLFFVADDGVHGRELWRSDGTNAGTLLVSDLSPGSVSADPAELTGLGSTVLFSANDGNTGIELWSSDGSESGTVLVKDIAPASASSFPEELTRLGSEIFFRARDDDHGVELWKTDGSGAGTVLVRDIVAGPDDSAPAHLESTSSTLFFTAFTEKLGRELWKTDGAATGTEAVKDIVPGPESSWPSRLTAVGQTIFFIIPDRDPYSYGSELWSSAGTEEGTLLVSSIEGIEPALILDALATTDLFYFLTAARYRQSDLWRSDGTTSGTFVITTLHGDPWSHPGLGFWPTPIGNELYFSRDDQVAGRELWKTDGSVAGTELIADLAPGPLASEPEGLGVLDGEVLFFADDFFHGPELWKSDGTQQGTQLVSDIVERSEDSHPGFLASDGREIFFGATDGTHGYELWTSDGTETGTHLVAERIPGPEPPVVVFPPLLPLYPTWSFAKVNGLLLAAVEEELWRSDGLGSSIEQVPLPDAHPEIYELVATDDLAFFAVHYEQLWRSDGTDEGTFQIGDFWCDVDDLTVAGDYTFFTSCLYNEPFKLWRSDGTASGTEAIFEGLAQRLTPSGDELVFCTWGYTEPHRLWQTIDGGAGGAVMIAELPSEVTAIEIAGATIFFTLNHRELWKSDGVGASAELLRSGLDPIQELTAAGDLLYFSANDSVHGEELWRSDGSVAGTVMVTDIDPGPSGSDPGELTHFDGKLFFAADDGLLGRELYVTDGTHTGTSQVADLWPGEPGSQPRYLKSASGVLYFSADDGFWGRELWRVTTPPTIQVENIALLEGHDGLTSATVPIALSHVSNSEARFSFGTRDRTATGGEDYASKRGTYSIPAGTLSAALELDIFGDRKIENDEEFHLKLNSPIDALLGTPRSRVILLNDDFAPGDCGLPDTIDLHLLAIDDPRVFSACTAITMRNMGVVLGGRLELNAGQRVVVGGGFAIANGGELAIVIDPSIGE